MLAYVPRPLRIGVRAVGLVSATVACVSVPAVTRLATGNAPRAVARVGSRAARVWSYLVCRLLGVRIAASHVPRGGPFLVASNHLSYLDIWVLGALYPSLFVAKREIGTWPLFGWISRAAGTLFVDRESPRDAVRAIRRMRSCLEHGVSITLFPEGRTSSGDRVRPFLPTLLQPAAELGIPCYAASLTYELPDDDAPPARTVCWFDGSNFVRHLVRLLGLRRIEARVSFSPSPIRSGDRKELAIRLWQHTSSHFVPLRDAARPA